MMVVVGFVGIVNGGGGGFCGSFPGDGGRFCSPFWCLI